MPDPQKHEALAQAGFHLQPTCESCEHWTPANAGWGMCAKIRYTHTKHTEEDRPTGTPSIGHCTQYETKPYGFVILAGNDYGEKYV